MEKLKNVLGLDPSLSSTGLIVLNSVGEKLYEISLKTKKLRGMERLKFIKDHLLMVIKKYEIEDVCIESYAFGVRQSRSKFNLGELGGIIRLTLHEQGVQYIDVAPPTLKKYVTGYGNADKIMMVEAVSKRWNIDFGKDADKADAYGLAKLAVELFLENKDLKKIIRQMQKDETKYL
jgi:crossover junction endodeoxyribonuclease RuvC